MNAFRVGVALLISSLAACAGRSEFSSDVTKFVQAADGNFASIQGPLKQTERYSKMYASTVTMRGADFCDVSASSDLNAAGCGFSAKTEADARARFDALVNAVRQAEPGWQSATLKAPPKDAMFGWRSGSDKLTAEVVLYRESPTDYSIDLSFTIVPYSAD